ncbi:hypothetical protein [Kibdelosporangium philippinense]|uniref:hypothetical protein n=1 Tax=Kibdelosporangium philippinense TaxID=211113 RepID=UPI003608ECBF
MSTVPEARVHRSCTPKYTFRHSAAGQSGELADVAISRRLSKGSDGLVARGAVSTDPGISWCRNGGHDMREWSTRHAGTVDTVCRNGRHGVQERWTHTSGTVDTACRNGGHGVGEGGHDV